MPLNARQATVKCADASAAIVLPRSASRNPAPMSTPAKAKPATAPMVFTANRLRDGRVVWLAEARRWVETVAEAKVFPPAEAAAGLALAQQDERSQQVVGVYGAEVAI